HVPPSQDQGGVITSISENVGWAKARKRRAHLHQPGRKGGHAEPVSARAFARPGGFAHPSVTGVDQSIPFCVVRSPGLASVRGRRKAATGWGSKEIGRPSFVRVLRNLPGGQRPDLIHRPTKGLRFERAWCGDPLENYCTSPC